MEAKSQTVWLREGDRNTRFFHNMANARRKVNKISKLKRDDGSWAESDIESQNVVQHYFMELFTPTEETLNYERELNCIRSQVSAEDNEIITRPFQLEEFREALFQVHPDKLPGPDGFNPAFYQKFWSLLKKDIYDNGVAWLERGDFPSWLTKTNLVLIPKVERASCIKHL